MIDIVVSKKDEVYAKITCERHIAKELSEFFTFYVPGYQFTPAFKNKIWDGKIRLYNLTSSVLYLGLLKYLEQFCEEREYSFEYRDDVDCEDEFSTYHAEKFAQSLNLSSRGVSIQAKDYQLNALVHVMQRRRALLISPTASGKSLMIYMIFRQLMDFQNLKGLIIVPNTSLVEQLFSDFVDYAANNDFSVDDNVHRIYEGKSKYSDKKLIISTWQSIYKMPPEWFEQFDYVIGDEAHNFKAQSLTTIMTSLVNTKYRVGLTGTLDGTKTHKLVLEGLFGVVKIVEKTKNLIERGDLAELDIKCLVLKHPPEVCQDMVKSKYPDEIQYLISCEPRNKFIRNLAISLKNNTLILYFMVDKHGKILYNMIQDTEMIGNRKVFFVHGGTETEDREEIRRIMENENDAIVVASYGTFSTGINIRNLHNVIFAFPYKANIKILQSIGRGLRLSSNKTKATLYDIADDMRHKHYVNHTLKHFMERVKIYTEQRFPFKLYKIGLKNGRDKDS